MTKLPTPPPAGLTRPGFPPAPHAPPPPPPRRATSDKESTTSGVHTPESGPNSADGCGTPGNEVKRAGGDVARSGEDCQYDGCDKPARDLYCCDAHRAAQHRIDHPSVRFPCPEDLDLVVLQLRMLAHHLRLSRRVADPGRVADTLSEIADRLDPEKGGKPPRR